ncbi:hypothetical protein Ahy_B06g085927 isoform B [Arachis hypogaea]|uniref:Uncharacterized protein n=1 Tax=Arachis hypogaea TaxID=3818 RepID=A0A444YW42_ARAHY|nr:hypothetical protein Ahy_B06g085927 isoform B [Arachis hypogaea]
MSVRNRTPFFGTEVHASFEGNNSSFRKRVSFVGVLFLQNKDSRPERFRAYMMEKKIKLIGGIIEAPNVEKMIFLEMISPSNVAPRRTR